MKVDAQAGCAKQLKLGVKGSMKEEFYAAHAKNGMVGLFYKRCGHRGCSVVPIYGLESTERADY